MFLKNRAADPETDCSACCILPKVRGRNYADVSWRNLSLTYVAILRFLSLRFSSTVDLE